jgi:hypothetical protein
MDLKIYTHHHHRSSFVPEGVGETNQGSNKSSRILAGLNAPARFSYASYCLLIMMACACAALLLVAKKTTVPRNSILLTQFLK